MIAATIIALARQTLIEFIDNTQFTTDAELLLMLSAEVPLLLERVIARRNASFPLPDDATQVIDVSAVAADGYALEALFWRVRRVELRDASGDRSLVRLVPESAGYSVPESTPSAFILAKKLFAVDGAPTVAADRRHGWLNAASARVLWIPRPADLATTGDTVKAPDEARVPLAMHLAWKMVLRAKPSATLIKEVFDAMVAAYQALDDTVDRYARDA